MGKVLRPLTIEEVEALSSRPRVRSVAVENFLMTMGDDSDQARHNVYLDLNLYKWNHQTVQAILDGIRLAERTPTPTPKDGGA